MEISARKYIERGSLESIAKSNPILAMEKLKTYQVKYPEDKNWPGKFINKYAATWERYAQEKGE